KDRLAAAQSLIATGEPIYAPWPPDIQQPLADRATLPSDEHKAIFDLVLLATAFAFLHELRHVLFDGEQDRPSSQAEEEMACDVWARDMLTSKLAIYAMQHEHSYEDVLKKRAMGLAIGATILYAITPPHSRGDSAQYPAIGRRIEALLSGTNLS